MGYAANTFARITRENYRDWMQRFYPKQKELMGLATNGRLLQEQLGRVDSHQANALRAAQLATANRNARMGVSNSPVADNTQGLRMALMTAGTENGLRDQEITRQLGILTGADAGLRDAIKVSRGN